MDNFPIGWNPELIAEFKEWEVKFWQNPTNDFEYTDDFRLARKNVLEEVAAYQKIKDSGCCGSFDTEATFQFKKDQPQEITIMYGFSYGH